MFIVGVLLISIVTACVPLASGFLNNHYGITIHSANKFLPAVAGLLFFIAWFLPDVHISNQTTTFQQHFVGGGFYGALLYIYFKQALGWALKPLPDVVVLFAWISALGVANEMLEFALTQLNIGHISTGDTDWDLLANTLGAFVCYCIYLIVKTVQKRVR